MTQSLRSLLAKEAVENFPIIAKTLPAGSMWVAQATCWQCGNNSNQENCCLAFVVPAGVTTATFEIWGGGGSGAGSLCCMVGSSGSSGAYSSVTIAVNEGDRYCTCYATGTSCAAATTGCRGCNTFVIGAGLDNFCAEGGYGGTSCCTAACGAFVTPGAVAQAYGGDINVPGVKSCHVVCCTSNYCHNKQFLAYPGGLINQNGGVVAMPSRTNGFQGEVQCIAAAYLGWGGHNSQYVPGMAGATAGVCAGTCACGVPGWPGMVRISYQ